MRPLQNLKGGSDEWTTSSTPTQEKVYAKLCTARQHENQRLSQAESGSTSASLPTLVDGKAGSFVPRTNREALSPKALFPLNALQNIIFIYPSSLNNRTIHQMPVDPTHGLVFSSTVVSPDKRRYDFYHRSSIKPIYSYSVHPTTRDDLSEWMPVLMSWRAPLCLRVWCGPDSKRDQCMEEILDILFGPSTRLIWLDVHLDLNNETAEHFISKQETKERANSIMRVRLDTTKCTTEAAYKLLTRFQALLNVKELTYGYELNNHDSLHFGRGHFYFMSLWSRLNVIDIAGELDEANCILLLTRCVRASSVTLRSLVNRDKDLKIVRHRHLALNFNSLCANIPPLNATYRRHSANSETTGSQTILPALKTLALVPSQFDTVGVLKHFTLPALEKLSLDTMLTANTNSLNDLHDLFLRSQAPLADLDIYDMFLGPPAVARLLRAVFIGTLSSPRLEWDAGLHARRWIRRAVKNFNVHFLSVLDQGKKRAIVPHDPIYRTHWKQELDVALANTPFKEWCKTVIPGIYITAAEYGPLFMNVGWGETSP